MTESDLVTPSPRWYSYRMSRILACFAALFFLTIESPAAETGFLSNARQLIFEGKRSGEGYFHGDGNLLVFQSEREEANPFYQIYLLDLLSGESARVSSGIGKTTCAFFQPGTSRLLFASTQLDPEAQAKQAAELEFRASGKQRRYSWDYDPAMDIFSCQQDGTEMTRLTDAPGYDAEGSFSPDGKKIVFCSLRAAFPVEKLSAEDKARFEKDPAYFGDIYIMNSDGSDQRRLTSSPGYDGGPFFSPDGERIIWRRFDASGMNADVFTMKTDGSDVQRITDFKSMSWAPFYHPSGQYIIFTSNKFGFENFELFIVDVKGIHEPVRVTDTDGFDGLPVFSPDGKRLSWTSNRTGDKKSQLFLANWNHPAAVKALEESPKRQRSAEELKAIEAQAQAADKHRIEQENETSPLPKAAGAVVHVNGATLTSTIAAADLHAEVDWLADPARQGRMTGTPGAEASANFLAEYLQSVGVKPLGNEFFQPFEFDAGVKMLPGKNRITLQSDGPAAEFASDVDFRPLSFSDSAEVEGEVVFAGYGLSVPEGNGGRYNSYEGLDVKDKVVLILRYVPEEVDPQRRAQLNRYAGLRYKAMMARERGAKAVLFVAGPNSPQAGDLIALTGDGTLAGSGIIAHSISGKLAGALLAPSGKDLKTLQSGLDTENPHAEGGFVLPKVRVRLEAGVEHIKKTDRSVVGWLPPGGETKDCEYVIVGAHYDHLGLGSNSSSMARSGEEEKVHAGADDNGSGVAVIMELAASLAGERAAHPDKFRRGIVFAFWSGEEIGLIGSAAFCEKPPVPLKQVAAYINFDMVGRLKENKLTIQGVGSSKLWTKLIEKRNVAAGFNLVLQDDPYLPTDTTSFYPKRIPVLNFFTGAHEDYHRPTDTAEKLNYEGAERIARMAQQIVLDVASAPERPDLARVERSDKEAGGSRETLRAYLGTIPDYTTEVKGVKLSGVRGGSPAEKGGIKGGDVLVEFASLKLANIYDYTYALDAVKIGQPIKVVVERDGKRLELTVTPEARK
ncbi:MAG: hypothetical protein JWL59_5140 [Chthoniobacteraceae bacterium]|nr:hypothetical protein [Chthoniobacteraceae bacterium]